MRLIALVSWIFPLFSLLDSAAGFHRRFAGIFAAAIKTTSTLTTTTKDDGDEHDCHAATATTTSVGEDENKTNDANDNNKDTKTKTIVQNSNEIQKKESSWIEDMEFEKYTPPEKQQDYGLSTSSSSVLSAFQLHPLLQIPVSFSMTTKTTSTTATNLTPVRTFCDTAAMRTVMSWDTVQRLGLTALVDRQSQPTGTRAIGVGSCHILGRLPSGILQLYLYGQVTVPSPTILVLDSSKDNSNSFVQLLLGLDFLREYQAILDLREEELKILVEGQEYNIPFLRPRGSNLPGLTQEGDKDSNSGSSDAALCPLPVPCLRQDLTVSQEDKKHVEWNSDNKDNDGGNDYGEYTIR